MRSYFYLFFIGLILTGCTEVQLASHVAKSTMNTPQQGTFKVGNPYEVAGKRYIPKETYNYSETGIASWYGPNFHGKRTANGEIFDRYELTAAHKTLQLPSLVRVTNLENGRSLIVRVNDRGPFKRGRIIDLSEKAADLLGFKGSGTAKVKIQVLAKESMKIAEAAKGGADTSGVEVAMNQKRVGRPVSAREPITTPATYQEASLSPVEREMLPDNVAVPGHIKEGKFMPDAVIQEMPVTPTSIYVQAGSFTQRENAQNLALSLQKFGNARVYPARVNGTQYYRVRLGPARTVDDADILLARLVNAHHNQAIIVVD